MTQNERRIYLIRKLLEEKPSFSNIKIPQNEQEQKNLLRSLFNIRMPQAVSREFLEVQDAYLQTEAVQKGITELTSLQPIQKNLYLWQGDITTLRCDAIVNAANNQMLGCFHPCHGCIDNIIHTKSGIQLRLLCNDIMNRQGHEEPTGQAKITPAFNLPSKYILHTVGPIISYRVSQKDRELLASCYRSCLSLAADNDCHSIAFCCISTGEFHFPNEQAAEIAVATVKEFLQEDTRIKRVVFNVFKNKDLQIYRKLLEENQC